MTGGQKISEKIAAFQAASPGKAFFSVEFFPAKTEEGIKNLEARFERFSTLSVFGVVVNWPDNPSAHTPLFYGLSYSLDLFRLIMSCIVVQIPCLRT